MSAIDKVMKYVEKELEKDPAVSNETLFQGAKKINRAVGRLSPRQFHAKYPLQVKRRGTNGKVSKGKAKKSATTRRVIRAANPDNEAVRKVMMRFAKDLASADNQTQTIEVLANMDRYVADIMKAARN